MIEIGNTVMFTDEHGKERVGIVTSLGAFEQPGMVGIVAFLSEGVYTRKVEDVRIAPFVIDHADNPNVPSIVFAEYGEE